MWNIDDVVRESGFCKTTIYGRIKQGKFPDSVLVNGRAMWDENEVLDAIEKRKMVVEIDRQTGLAIEELARLQGASIGDLVSMLMTEAIKARTQANPLYPVQWRQVFKGVNPTLKDYVSKYNQYVAGIRGDQSVKFDLLLKNGSVQKHKDILPLALREVMGTEEMKALGYTVIGIDKINS